VKLVYDNDISYRIAHALRELVGEEHEVVALRDLFPEISKRQSVPDMKWLARLGSEGITVAVSADGRILRSKAERAAWLDAGVQLYVQPNSVPNLSMWDQMVWHLRVFPLIVGHATSVTSCAAFRIPRSGSKFTRID